MKHTSGSTLSANENIFFINASSHVFSFREDPVNVSVNKFYRLGNKNSNNKLTSSWFVRTWSQGEGFQGRGIPATRLERKQKKTC